MSFVHLHVHTEYSLLDGLTKIKKLIGAVKEMGMPACAITDHGNMYGAIEFYKTAVKNEIKPIIGAEMYVAPLGRADKSAQSRKAYHLILLAKNTTGYKNLMKLVSISHSEGFYYKPRIDYEVLEKYHEGLICTSACLEGEVSKAILDNNLEQAKKKIEIYKNIFGDDFYLEVQRHPGLDKQEIANKAIISLSRELGIPLVGTNDAHYLKKDDAFAQDVLLMIGTQATVNDSKRLSMLDVPDFYVKSPEEMASQFTDIPDALENTLHIADKCDLSIEIGKWYFPNFELPKGKTAEETLQELVYAQAKEHYGELSSEIVDRLEYELEVICTKGYAGYFLIMRDFIQWCEANSAPTNTRGSAAGCFVAFVLGITSVDPLIYTLPFERFLNKDRPSPPDIDLDIADTRRQDMLYHIIDQYGKEAVAQICTFGRMLARGAVRDVSRVLGYEYAIGDKIAKLIPPPKQGFPVSIDKALNEAPDLKTLYENEPDAKKILDAASQIYDVARHISVHACAIVISPTTINDFSPTQLETGGNKCITQYEMHACEDVGLIKFDILGIDNLSFLAESIKNVKKSRNIDINLRKLPLDDKKTFQMLSAGNTMGVFQLSGEGMTKWLKELQPNRVEDLMAMVALYRPGPMGIIPDYIARKKDPSLITYFDPKMEKYLKKSYGLLVYQDDCLYTAIELAGYNWVEVDKFRKAIGKKIPEEMAAQKEKFIQGCITNGYTEEKAHEIFANIEPFTSYGFNKAHAASYGMLAYRTAYMKANFPVEYMCALLTAKADDTETVSSGIQECRNLGIIVSPPDINKSHSGFEMETNKESLDKMAIRFGFSAIKNVGEAAINTIITEREVNGPFKNVADFCLRVEGQKVNKKVLECLIKVGAFDTFGNRRAILQAVETIRTQADKLNTRKTNGQFGLFDADDHASISSDNLPDVADFEPNEKLAFEKELLGIFVSDNPTLNLLKPFQILHAPKITDVLNTSAQKSTRFSGVINKFKVITTKKDGSRMAFATLEDETAKIEIVIFPKLFAQIEPLLIENNPVFVEGKVNEREGQISVIADTVSDTLPENAPKYDFVIEVPPGTTQTQLVSLNRLLKNNPNGHKGLIILPNGRQIPLSYGVRYSPELQTQISEILRIS